MPTADFPLVDAADIRRFVGSAAFDRARPYARNGAVSKLEWDAPAGELRATVAGTRSRPYRCQVSLEVAPGNALLPVHSSCDCPVGTACKHVAAALLAGNARSVADAPGGRSSDAGWRGALGALAQEAGGASARHGGSRDAHRVGSGARPAPLALELEVRQAVRRSGARWQRASSATVSANARSTGPLRVTMRPVTLGKSGRWVGGNLTWSSLQYQIARANLDERQVRWFGQFSALARASAGVYVGQESERLTLDDFTSPLLWQLLKLAPELGIALVYARKGGAVVLGRDARVELHAGRRDEELELSPVVSIDGLEIARSSLGFIADHGLYSVEWTPEPVLTLAPTDLPVTHAQRRLIEGDAIVVPPRDEPEFFTQIYPGLQRAIALVSPDDSVRFPVLAPPALVLTVTFRKPNTIGLGWDWEYRVGEGGVRLPLLADEAETIPRDPAVEAASVARVDAVLAALLQPGLEQPGHEHPGHGRLGNHRLAVHPAGTTLRDLDAAEFTTDLLPVLDQLDGLLVCFDGGRPDFHELTATPVLRVTTVQTDQRDWFDLGVIVHVAGREVPFQPLFSALSKGRKKLLLVDRSYLSLDQPVFDRLRELIEEAQALAEWETGPRISRYQAGLWADFEDLADESEPARAWRDSVGGLLALTGGADAGADAGAPEPVPVSAGVRAELRPYQRDGFHWLVFLWKHGLGGVLADDMGLGKTLQTLALIAHARAATSGAGAVGGGPGGPADQVASPGERIEPSQGEASAPPFLVVVPSSVVGNWVSEAARFTPDLKVVAITATRRKDRTPLAKAIAAADIVVTTYTLFRIDFAVFDALEWAGLILDEAQFVKNHTSRAHRCARDLAAPFKLAITGTPMENNLMELWAMFAIVAPGLFPSSRRFTEEYVRPIDNARSDAAATPAVHGAERIARLRRRIRPLMMRRTKELVAPELPAKQEQVLTIELAPRHRALYDTFLQRERQKLLGLIDDLDRNRFIVFRSLTLLRMLALDASLIDEQYGSVPSSKLDALLEQLDDVLAEGHRALVFSQFTSYLSKVAARLHERGLEHVYLDGSTRRRGEVIDRFRQGEASVFLISLKAGGFGLNLTEADYVFMLDPWWNPAAEQQAIDRTHRIGQTKSVMVYRLVAADTIEEKVVALGEQKARLFDAVLDEDAAFASTLTADDLRALLD
ncbi:MAG TPA: DEAD/DEAH box helicase [Humibacter sp.]|nr:DEAD/DEAH box helicase [Humibacter sp.]